MVTLLQQIEKLNLPKIAPMQVPVSVFDTAARLGLTVKLTSPSVPEQYELTCNGVISGYIRVRRGSFSVSYPGPGDELLYDGQVDGFGGFTDREREPNLLFALKLISDRITAA